jgi:hypothetical protein
MTIIIQKGDLDAASFSNNDATNTGGIVIRTDAGSVVEAAITAAIAAIPADKFLQGLQSYNATTNVLTLLMNDTTTVDVDLSDLIADATAEITTDKVSVFANDGTTLLGYLLPV